MNAGKRRRNAKARLARRQAYACIRIERLGSHVIGPVGHVGATHDTVLGWDARVRRARILREAGLAVRDEPAERLVTSWEEGLREEL